MGKLEQYGYISFFMAGIVFLESYSRPPSVMIFPTVVAACLITVMLRPPTPGGVIVFSVMYGFFSGACEYTLISLFDSSHRDMTSTNAVFSMINPAVTSFATNVNEVGTRFGIAAFFFGIALLTGNPISGALLNPPQYTWSRAVVFNVVCRLLNLDLRNCLY